MAPIAFVIAGYGKTIAGVLFWFAALLAVASAFVAVIYILRWIALNKSAGRKPGFTIEQIDRLHDEDVLTDEEYRLARRTVLGLTDPDTPEK